MAVVVFALQLTVVSGASDIYVYRASITNTGMEQIRLSLTGKATEKPVVIDFKNGRLALQSYYYSAARRTRGQHAYFSVPDGETFTFVCVLEAESGTLRLSVNGEEYLQAVYSNYIGVEPQYVWYANSSSTAVSSESTVTISEEKSFLAEQEPQSVSLASCSVAEAALQLAVPASYSELLKLKVTDENENNVALCDIVKDETGATLKFKSALEPGTTYTVSGRGLYDIYGREFSFSESFVPQTEGTVAVGQSIVFSEETEKILNFETEKVWRTEADLLGKNPDFTLNELTVELTNGTGGYEAQAYAAPLSAEHKNSGSYAIRWDRHHFYPTLSAELPATDWTGANLLRLWLYSEQATNETVMLTVYSDNPNTLWKDGYTFPILIDFAGEKELAIPLEDFYRLNEPTGFSNVTGIYFAAKMFDQIPNPETVLYIDNIRIEYDEDYMLTPRPGVYKKEVSNRHAAVFDRELLNHSFPEVQTVAGIDTETDRYISYQPYHKAEYALYGYYPRYAPAVPSFDNEGNAYILKNGFIQYLTDDGVWLTVDLEAVYLKLFPHHEFRFSISDEMFQDETVVRFDSDGGVYVALTVYEQAYLLYSPDRMQTWQGYYLLRETEKTTGTAYVRFERIEAHNTAAGEKPPVFLLYGKGTGHLVIPEKTESGTLSFTAVTYGENVVSPAAHSGDGNALISVGDNIYLVYSKYAANLTEAEAAALPAEDAAANQLSWTKDGTTHYSKNGTAAYIRQYSRETGVLSEPVFAGYGGSAADDHNWPVITVDSEKRLHVMVNGHHNPIYYTHTLNRDDISAWSEPVLFGGDDSYASLLTDKNDTMYVITRNSGRGYRFDLVLYKKAKGETEFTKEYLVQRIFAFYNVWRNRMSYDPASGKIYVNYFSQSSHFEVGKEGYDTYLYTYPHLERRFLKQESTPPSNIDTRPIKWYQTVERGGGSEGVVLVSEDGSAFELATTADFKGRAVTPVSIVGITQASGSTTVQIHSASVNEEAEVFLALYADGQLEQVLRQPVTLAEGETADVSFAVTTAGKTVRAFLWDEALKPLCPA